MHNYGKIAQTKKFHLDIGGRTDRQTDRHSVIEMRGLIKKNEPDLYIYLFYTSIFLSIEPHYGW